MEIQQFIVKTNNNYNTLKKQNMPSKAQLKYSLYRLVTIAFELGPHLLTRL